MTNSGGEELRPCGICSTIGCISHQIYIPREENEEKLWDLLRRTHQVTCAECEQIIFGYEGDIEFLEKEINALKASIERRDAQIAEIKFLVEKYEAIAETATGLTQRMEKKLQAAERLVEALKEIAKGEGDYYHGPQADIAIEALAEWEKIKA